MDVLYDILMIVAILLIALLIVLNMRKRLLKLWKEVSFREIVFHRVLTDSIRLFYSYKDALKNEENRLQFIRLGRSRRKKARYLLLKERQELYLCISDIYNEIHDSEDPQYEPLKKQYQTLQKARRIYNSKVLLYNQQISVFPTRYLAIKLNLKTKEYFG
jgi:hypothetical protein